MGAGTGNRNNMDAARRQQAMEGQAMRRRAIQQQEQCCTQEQVTPFETSAPDGTWQRLPPNLLWDVVQKCPEMRSGINFGPGRANRIPEQGSPEYEQLLQRVRGLGQMRR
jgi:hypothetical protein